MPKTVHVPVLGNVPKPALIMGIGAGGLVAAYMIYKHKQNAAAPTGGAYGYGAGAYGYSSGYYGYGSEFAYGGSMGAGFSPYPVASEYGYGAFGYGYYNPYTGQWLGGGQSQPPPVGGGTQPPPVNPGGPIAGGGKPGTHTITANGHDDLWRTAHNNSISEGTLIRLNPKLSHLVGSKRPIPRGTRVKV